MGLSNYTLSPTRIHNAKAKDKPYKLSDGGGQFVGVSPAGQKAWRYQYRIGGSRRDVKIGRYPEVGVADARERHFELGALLERGIDPAAILRMLAVAAEAKLEGRIVPVARSRAQGISRMASLDDKVRAWAAATGVNATPLLACLAKSIAAPSQDIVEQALRFDEASAESDVDAERSEDRLVVLPLGADECNHSH